MKTYTPLTSYKGFEKCLDGFMDRIVVNNFHIFLLLKDSTTESLVDLFNSIMNRPKGKLSAKIPDHPMLGPRFSAMFSERVFVDTKEELIYKNGLRAIDILLILAKTTIPDLSLIKEHITIPRKIFCNFKAEKYVKEGKYLREYVMIDGAGYSYKLESFDPETIYKIEKINPLFTSTITFKDNVSDEKQKIFIKELNLFNSYLMVARYCLIAIELMRLRDTIKNLDDNTDIWAYNEYVYYAEKVEEEANAQKKLIVQRQKYVNLDEFYED